MIDRLRLLLALDGTGYSEAAVELGLRWSRDLDASLCGLAVVDEPALTKPESMSIGASHFAAAAHARRLHDASETVDRILRAFDRRCREAGVPCERLYAAGPPLEVILRESHRFDVVLMGTHTYFEFATRETEDHVLDEMLRRSPRPVVATPDGLPEGGNVVVAYDGEDAAARALQAFQPLYRPALGPIHVVSIGQMLDHARALAARAVDFLAFHGLRAAAVPVASRARMDEALLETVRGLRPGLVVMGGRAHSRLRNRLLGSTTRMMLDRCGAPLFLYH